VVSRPFDDETGLSLPDKSRQSSLDRLLILDLIYDFLLAHPRWCLALLLLVTAVLAVPAARIPIDSSIDLLNR